MLLESIQNIVLLIVMPGFLGTMMVLRILTLYRDREIQLHQNKQEAIRLRREYEGDSAMVDDLIEV